MTNADLAIEKLLAWDFTTVLDIGAGGSHADTFRSNGKHVTTLNLYDADIVGDYCATILPQFDCIWASHVLEHQPNPNRFLTKCFRDLKDNGILAVTVPPLKHNVVGGHVNLYNAGLLLYQLILAGFDCSLASVKTYGYNISVLVKKRSFEMPALKMDDGDLEVLAPYFPFPVDRMFDGRISEVNW